MTGDEQQAFIDLVREKAAIKLLFLPHAVSQMNRPERMITPSEVRNTVLEGEMIEDYPEDVRGHSCLISGTGERSRPIHVVCAPKDDYLAIITTYIPDEKFWSDDFRTRRKP